MSASRSIESASPTSSSSVSSSIQTKEPDDASKYDFACIDLLCNLEFLMADFRVKPMGERFEIALKTADQILLKLLDFCVEHFESRQIETIHDQIRRTLQCFKNHRESLKNQSWGFALRSLVSSNATDPATVVSYDKLGKSVVHTCGMVFTEMLELVRIDSDVRSQIDQSSAVFLNELKCVW